MILKTSWITQAASVIYDLPRMFILLGELKAHAKEKNVSDVEQRGEFLLEVGAGDY